MKKELGGRSGRQVAVAMPWRFRAVLGFQNGLLAMVRRALFAAQGAAALEPRSIAVYRTARLGDFINAVPALWSLRHRFPGARITLLTASTTDAATLKVTSRYAESSQLPWLGLLPPGLVDETVVLRMVPRAAALEQARRYFEAHSPDAFFLLPYSGESLTSRLKKVAYLRTAGLKAPLYGWQIQSTFGVFRKLQGERGYHRHQVLAAIDGVWQHPAFPPRLSNAGDVVFRLHLSAEDEAWADAWLRTRDWNRQRVVAVLPGASYPHKVWPLARFSEVCRELRAEGGWRFVVVGISQDNGLADELAAEMGSECANLCGRTTLGQLAALLARCSLYLGNDSGPAHLAAAVGCPCITLTASIEPPGMVEPFGQAAGEFRHPEPCAPCYSYTHCPLGTAACITAIDPAEVVRSARKRARPRA